MAGMNSEQSESTQLANLMLKHMQFGDIQSEKDPSPKKNLRSQLRNIVGISSDQKKCKILFQESKLFEQSQKYLNPTNFRLAAAKSPQKLKHSSPSSYPTPASRASLSEDKSINSPLSSASRQLPSSLTFFSPLSANQNQDIQKILEDALQSSHLSLQTIKYLKSALRQNEISLEHRKEFFLVASGAHVSMKLYKGYYQALTKNFNQFPENYFNSINQDVTRTRCNQTSQIEQEIFQQKLRNILSAYAVRNPFMQYCQGMNFLGMFLLEHITEGDEEQAFWILAQLIECILSIEMYSNPSYFRSYLAILEEYLRQLCPDIFNKLKKNKMQLLVFPFNEIFSLFTCSLPTDISIVILMNVLMNGQRALFQGILTLLTIAKPNILKANNISELNDALQTLKETGIGQQQFQTLFNSIYINKRAFNMAQDLSLKEHQQSIGNKFEEHQNIHHIYKKISKNNQCSLDSPICSHVNRLNKHLNRGFSVFIFKIKQLIVAEDQDHFRLDKKPNIGLVQSQNLEDNLHGCNNNFDDLLIGRFTHICKIDYENIQETNLNDGTTNKSNQHFGMREKSLTQQQFLGSQNQDEESKLNHFKVRESIILDGHTAEQSCSAEEENESRESQQENQLFKPGCIGKSLFFESDFESQYSEAEFTAKIDSDTYLSGLSDSKVQGTSVKDTNGDNLQLQKDEKEKGHLQLLQRQVDELYELRVSQSQNRQRCFRSQIMGDQQVSYDCMFHSDSFQKTFSNKPKQRQSTFLVGQSNSPEQRREFRKSNSSNYKSNNIDENQHIIATATISEQIQPEKIQFTAALDYLKTPDSSPKGSENLSFNYTTMESQIKSCSPACFVGREFPFIRDYRCVENQQCCINLVKPSEIQTSLVLEMEKHSSIEDLQQFKEQIFEFSPNQKVKSDPKELQNLYRSHHSSCIQFCSDAPNFQ